MGTINVLHNGADIPEEFLEAMAATVVGWHEALKQISHLQQQLAVADARCRELRAELDTRTV